MTKNSHYLLLFSLLIIIGLIGWYIASPEQLNLLSPKQLATTPDAVIHDLTVVKFDKQGAIAHRLSTPKLEHIPQNNVSLLKSPRITAYQHQQNPWHISADKGRAINGSTKVILSSNVIVHQAQGKQNKASTFRSEKLVYYPRKHYADTDVAVTLEQPGVKVKAIGMQAYIDEKRVKLLHQVRGNYATG